MRPNELIAEMKTAFELKSPLMIWGKPGVGKSRLVEQTTHELDARLVDMRVLYFDPTDLRGIQALDRESGTTKCFRPEFYPVDGEGILFLDELPAATPTVQAACYQLTLDRRIGEYKLPDGWVVFAAGNHQGDRAVSNRMPSPLVSRMTHLELEVDVDDWTEWALKADVHPLVVAFIRFRQMSALFNFDPSKWDAKPYACPRTWEMVSHRQHHADEKKKPMRLETLKGIVGDGAGTEFFAYLDLCKTLPDLDALLLNPETTPVPKEPGVRYAVATGLAHKATKGNMEQVLAYIARLPKEFEIMSMRDALRRDEDLSRCKCWIDWAVKNKGVLS